MAFRPFFTLLACISQFLILSVFVQAGSYQLKTGNGYKNPSGGTIQYTDVSLPYSGTNGSYGASAGDPSFVSCSGAITTVYEWVPAQITNPAPGSQTDQDPDNNTIPDPLDTPPANIIVTEYCKATYSYAYFIPDGSGSGSCDNGLGFDAITESGPLTISTPGGSDGEGGTEEIIGYAGSGVSEGTRYAKMAGSQTITLT
jgi:hypothetical protein